MAKANRLGPQGCPVLLELTGDEADALYTLLWMIGGDPKGPRGQIDNIFHAMNNQAVSLCGHEGASGTIKFSGSYKGGKYK